MLKKLLVFAITSGLAAVTSLHAFALGPDTKAARSELSGGGKWTLVALHRAVRHAYPHTEHGPRTWDYLRAMPFPRRHLYAAKALCVLGVVAAMSLLLGVLTVGAVGLAGWWKPVVAPTGTPDIATFALLLARIFVASWLLVAVQLWIALRYASFVPALATGIGGTFFAVVATSAKAGMLLPWQIPVNQLAAQPERADITLALGCVGGCVAFALMLARMSRREVLA